MAERYVLRVASDIAREEKYSTMSMADRRFTVGDAIVVIVVDLHAG